MIYMHDIDVERFFSRFDFHARSKVNDRKL